MSDETAIKVEHVSKDFVLPHEKANSLKSLFTSAAKRRGKQGKETQHALKDISFEIKKGEFFGIVGRNGSGKSTLLKILAGIYQPTSGKTHTSGKLVPFIELGVGFNPELTGRENVYLNGAMLGFSEKEVEAMYDDIVAFAELERFMDQKLKNYSSGMQVRLAFSMATRSEADILLIDEVLAVGDADFQRKCFSYFKKLKKAGKTVVFVTHDMEAVREYCDQAMLIEKNQVKHIGDTDTVAENYLKLFMKESNLSKHDDSNRWGDNQITIVSIKVKVESTQIRVSEQLKVHANRDGCVVGIRIRNAAGQPLTGTNTKLEGSVIENLIKDELVIVEWKIPNFLTDGDYYIDSAVQHLDAISVHDWRDEVAAFSVKKLRKVPYVTDPGFEVDIRRLT